jgi:hypothetical protein
MTREFPFSVEFKVVARTWADTPRRLQSDASKCKRQAVLTRGAAGPSCIDKESFLSLDLLEVVTLSLRLDCFG